IVTLRGPSLPAVVARLWSGPWSGNPTAISLPNSDAPVATLRTGTPGAEKAEYQCKGKVYRGSGRWGGSYRLRTEAPRRLSLAPGSSWRQSRLNDRPGRTRGAIYEMFERTPEGVNESVYVLWLLRNGRVTDWTTLAKE